MATGLITDCVLGPPGPVVKVSYDTVTLVVQQITYSNTPEADAVAEAAGPPSFSRSWKLQAGNPGGVIDVSGQGVRLVNRTIDKAGGPVTVATWPDGWSFAVRWPA